MHIAIGLNWIPELMQLPDLDKQLFAVELTSHLALQNAMPSTLSISRLAVNTLATLLSGKNHDIYIKIMPQYVLLRLSEKHHWLMCPVDPWLA